MLNSPGLSARRTGFKRAIGHLHDAGKAGLITTALADKLQVSDTTAKSYMRTMVSCKIITIKTAKSRVGSPANCAVLIASQEQIDAFLMSDKISKRQATPATPRRRPKRVDAFVPAPSGPRVYADLPIEFFRAAGQVSA